LAAWKGPEEVAGNVVNGDGVGERKDSKIKVQAKMQLDGRWFGVVGRAEW
jgi:hypothetical protein